MYAVFPNTFPNVPGIREIVILHISDCPGYQSRRLMIQPAEPTVEQVPSSGISVSDNLQHNTADFTMIQPRLRVNPRIYVSDV